jgi:hypothetical protein
VLEGLRLDDLDHAQSCALNGNPSFLEHYDFHFQSSVVSATVCSSLAMRASASAARRSYSALDAASSDWERSNNL